MGGDYKPASVRSTTAQDLKALTDFGPGAYQALARSVREGAPADAQLAYNQYAQFEPQYFRIGEQLQDQAAKEAIRRDLETFRGGGRELATEALALDQMANPEFYANRAIAGKGFQDLIAGQDPNKLSGAELANVERGVNRLNANAGVANVGDATTTASNAMQFGDELNKKRNQFAQSLALFPGIQQGSTSNVNAYQVAAGRGAAQGNVSQGQYKAPQQFDANQFYANTQNQIGQARGNRENIMANRRTGLDFFNQTAAFGAGPNGASGACCFIFLESFNGKLPEHVRFCRDIFYHKNPRLSVGYKRMAKWLVPLMQKSDRVKHLVNQLMVLPITRYGSYLVGNTNSYNLTDKLLKSFWFKVWSLT